MCLLARADGGAPQIPGPGELLSRLHKPHPRLLATERDFATLKERVKTEPRLQEWSASLATRAQTILGQAPSRYEIPDGLRLLATSRRVLDRIYTLGLVYRLQGDRRYLDRAWKELEAAAHFPDWNPRHFLDTAEMTHAFAIAYDWLYDDWSADQRQTLREAIVQMGFTPALKTYRARNWWAAARHNWNQVCNGGMGLGALALADVDPQPAGEILHDALASLPLAMAEFAPDGAWKEGPGYWNYATSYNVVLLAALQTALGTDFGLSDMRGFNETGSFPLYLTGPLGRTFNYADGGDNAIRAPQMFWLARRFQHSEFAWYEQRLASPSAQDFLWFTTNDRDPKSLNLPLDKYFRGAEVVALRSAWEDPKALFVGFKGGDNKANHSHLDLGSFVFDALGVRWAVDLGADDYNLPGYFGKQRWDYYRLRAEGQNTLLINPGEGPDQDPAAAAPVISFHAAPERPFAVVDLTSAYRKSATKAWRGLILPDRNALLVQDEVQCARPVDLWWFMHTPAAIEIEPDGHVARLQQMGVQLRAQILVPSGAAFQMMDAQPLASSPHPERQAKNEKVKKLAIHLSGLTETRLAVLLTPQNEKRSATPPKVVALSDW